MWRFNVQNINNPKFNPIQQALIQYKCVLSKYIPKITKASHNPLGYLLLLMELRVLSVGKSKQKQPFSKGLGDEHDSILL